MKNINYPKPDKVYQCLLSSDDMCTIDNDCMDFWADYDCIIENKLEKFLTIAQVKALENGYIDFIVFGLDN